MVNFLCNIIVYFIIKLKKIISWLVWYATNFDLISLFCYTKSKPFECSLRSICLMISHQLFVSSALEQKIVFFFFFVLVSFLFPNKFLWQLIIQTSSFTCNCWRFIFSTELEVREFEILQSSMFTFDYHF